MTTTEEARTPGQDAAVELKWLRSQVIGLCEHTEDKAGAEIEKPGLTDHERGFHKGAYTEAKGIRRAIAEVVRCRLKEIEEATPAPSSPGVPDSVRALSEAATQGEWYTESEKCDGSYGSGEDCSEGYLAYSILTDAERPYGNPGVVAETSNSTLGVIHEESDEDGHTAWDETARANTAFIVAAVNYVRTLLSAHPAGQGADLVVKGKLSKIEHAALAWLLDAYERDECCTPGAVYSEHVTPTEITLKVHLPASLRLSDDVARTPSRVIEGSMQRAIRVLLIQSGYTGLPSPASLIPEHPEDSAAFDIIRRAAAHITEAKPAPDSTRMGQVETVAVPVSALRWLFGEGPDADGRWFGDWQEGDPVLSGTFWWRSEFRKRVEAARPATPEVQGAERVRHVKRGTEYEVLGEAEAQVSGSDSRITERRDWLTDAIILEDGDKLMVYRGTDGRLWCRPTDEFRDGRFVPASSGQESA